MFQKRKSTYIRVHNDYGYYTMDIDGGKVPDVTDMPKKARLRVRVSNTDSVQFKEGLECNTDEIWYKGDSCK